MKEGKIEQTKGDQEFFGSVEEEKEEQLRNDNGYEYLRKRYCKCLTILVIQWEDKNSTYTLHIRLRIILKDILI